MRSLSSLVSKVDTVYVNATVDAELLPSNQIAEPNRSPSSWKAAEIGVLVDAGKLLLKNGFAEDRHNQVGVGVLYLQPFNMREDGRIDLSQAKYVELPRDPEPYLVQQGDIIFNNMNSKELVGKTALFPYKGTFLLSNHMTIIRLLDPSAIDPYWLALDLLYLWSRGYFRAICRRHVNQASVSLERLKGVEIALPPLPEQRAIAHVLRAVDEKIDIEERRKRALETLFKTLLHNLMTGKLRVGEPRAIERAAEWYAAIQRGEAGPHESISARPNRSPGYQEAHDA
jgi:type I restriction enzyme S subunit